MYNTSCTSSRNFLHRWFIYFIMKKAWDEKRKIGAEGMIICYFSDYDKSLQGTWYDKSRKGKCFHYKPRILILKVEVRNYSWFKEKFLETLSAWRWETLLSKTKPLSWIKNYWMKGVRTSWWFPFSKETRRLETGTLLGQLGRIQWLQIISNNLKSINKLLYFLWRPEIPSFC